MKISIMTMMLALVLAPSVRHAWSQHEGHGGGMAPMPQSDPAADARQEAEHRRNKLTKLQDKIDGVEKQLEDTALTPKKRMGIENKLKKLYAQKDRLLGESRGEAIHASAHRRHEPESDACGQGKDCKAHKQVTYACPMGDYQGPATQDDRCPKCGMTLQKQSKATTPIATEHSAGERQDQQAVYICSMGDYRGPMTQDGRCPKCGMTLQKQ